MNDKRIRSDGEDEKDEDYEPEVRKSRKTKRRENKKKKKQKRQQVEAGALKPWMARDMMPTELLEQSEVVKCHIIKVQYGRSKFTVQEGSTERELHDPFVLMPSLSSLFTFHLLVHPATAVVTQVVQVRAGSVPMESARYKATTVTSARLWKALGWNPKHSFQIKAVHSLFTRIKDFDKASVLAEGVDNYFVLRHQHVHRCRMYPLSIALACDDEQVYGLFNTPEVWKLGFREPDSYPPHVSPMRLAPLLARPLDIDDPVDTIVAAAKHYDAMVKNKHTIWYATKDVPKFLFEHGFVKKHPADEKQCGLAVVVDALMELEQWMDGTRITPAAFWQHPSVMYLPYDHDFSKENGIQHRLMQVGCEVVTMSSSVSVRGAYGSFMGFAARDPVGSPVAVIIPHLDKWTALDLRRALIKMREWKVFVLLLHGNMRVMSHLTEFVRVRVKHVCAMHSRDPTHPVWIQPDPPLDSPISLSSRDIPYGGDTPPDPSIILPPRGTLSFVPHTEENHRQFVAWYTRLREYTRHINHPFLAQAFVYDFRSSAMWRETMNKEGIVTSGSKLITADGTMLAVNEVLAPSQFITNPALGSTAQCKLRASHRWVLCSTYSSTFYDHSRCCGSLGYSIPAGTCINLALHHNDLADAELLFWGGMTIPKVKVVIVYAPCIFTINHDFLRFLISCMSHATDAVIVYGISRQSIDSAMAVA